MTRVRHPANETKISVVILNYNYESFVGDAIESVLAQTYQNLECIVVDDCSTDRSADVISRFPTVRFVQKKSNSGQTGAARLGLACATGDLVLFLDSDDLLFPNACAKIAHEWRPGVSAVFFRLAIFKHGAFNNEHLPSGRFVQEGAADFVRKYGYLPAAPTSGNAFATDVAKKIFSDSLGFHDRCHIDTWLINCAPFLGSVSAIDRCLGAYRIHGANASLTGKRTLIRLKVQNYCNYWAQRSAIRFAGKSNLAPKWDYLTGPYWLKWHIITSHVTIPHFDLPARSEFLCALECCREFLTFPAIPPFKRVANFMLIFSFLILPRRLGRRLLATLYPSESSADPMSYSSIWLRS